MALTYLKNAYEMVRDVHNHINDKKEYVLKPEQYQNPQQSLWWIGLKDYSYRCKRW